MVECCEERLQLNEGELAYFGSERCHFLQSGWTKLHLFPPTFEKWTVKCIYFKIHRLGLQEWEHFYSLSTLYTNHQRRRLSVSWTFISTKCTKISLLLAEEQLARFSKEYGCSFAELSLCLLMVVDGAWLEKHKGMQFMKRCSGALLMNGNSAKIQEREKKQKLNCKKTPPTGLHSLFAHPRVCA